MTIRAACDCETWTLRDFPQVAPAPDRMGTMVRVIDVRQRQLLMERRLAARIAACGEPPSKMPTTREVWAAFGIAFMLGAVVGGFIVMWLS